ncbi:uncharacterized protein AAGF69_002709 [Amazona ochrocephala]
MSPPRVISKCQGRFQTRGQASTDRHSGEGWDVLSAQVAWSGAPASLLLLKLTLHHLQLHSLCGIQALVAAVLGNSLIQPISSSGNDKCSCVRLRLLRSVVSGDTKGRKMRMHKMILMFILLFTGYLCEDPDFTEDTTLSHNLFDDTEFSQAPKSETTEHESDHVPGLVPEKRLSTLLVAGISISSVFILILVIAGLWYARKKSKGSSAEINCVACSEPGVFLRGISMHENQHEWPFEQGALQ